MIPILTLAFLFGSIFGCAVTALACWKGLEMADVRAADEAERRMFERDGKALSHLDPPDLTPVSIGRDPRNGQYVSLRGK